MPAVWQTGFQYLLEDARKKKRQIEHLYLSQYCNDFIISLNRYADQMLYKAAGVCAREYGIAISDSGRLPAARRYRHIFCGVLVQYIGMG